MMGVLPSAMLEPGDTRGGTVVWGARPHLRGKPEPPPAAFDARDFWNGE
jgi:hypothetical protein